MHLEFSNNIIMLHKYNSFLYNTFWLDKENKLKTFIKWPGGKERELPIIRKFIPKYKGRYIEPFVGGGAVFFDIDNKKCLLNDKSKELIDLYTFIKKRSPSFLKLFNKLINEFESLNVFADRYSENILDLYHSKIGIDVFISKFSSQFDHIAEINHSIFEKELEKNLKSKIARSNALEEKQGKISNEDKIDNIEAALKSAYYMYVRNLYNGQTLSDESKKAALFFFIREYCYSSMFRYNSKGEFNVPYGGISYNRKDIKKKYEYILSDAMRQKLKNCELYNYDFEEFLNMVKPKRDDFIFLDPPYDSDFSTYANNSFDKEEQIRLRNYLTNTKAKILLVIKNTEFIYNLYKDDFKISDFDKKYMVSFMNRNDKDVKHLVVTNYTI